MPTVNIPATALLITAHLPAVVFPGRAAVPVTALTATAHTPTITGRANVDVTLTTLSITAHLPTLSAAGVFDIPSTSMSATAHLPTLSAGAVVSIPLTSCTLTATAPVMSAKATVAIPVTAMTATAHIPTVEGASVDLTGDFARECRCWLDYDLTVAAGTATITLYANGVEVATGSGAVGGAVTFTGDNISGAVTVAADAVTDEGRVYWHYPKSMRIKRDTTNPPTTVIATMAFDKKDQRTWSESTDLAAGTYHYRIQPINAEGDIGDDSATASKTISGFVAPVTALAYASGGATACVITWTKSTTAGCTYNVYVEQPGTGYMDFSTPHATTLADAETATLAISPTTGTARVVVRASKSGVEETNNTTLSVSFSSGTYVPPQPNTPTILEQNTTVDSGNVVRTYVCYPIVDEAGTGATINIYKRAQGGSYNYSSALATGTLATVREGVKASTLVGSLGADGVYYIVARAATAAGVESASSDEVMVVASAANIAAPTFTAKVSRG